jgi:hypothetical protein
MLIKACVLGANQLSPLFSLLPLLNGWMAVASAAITLGEPTFSWESALSSEEANASAPVLRARLVFVV